MLSWIWVLIVGAIIGLIAGFITGKGGSMGFIANLIAGLVGSTLGQAIFGSCGYGISGTVGIFALNIIIGGLIGGLALIAGLLFGVIHTIREII